MLRWFDVTDPANQSALRICVATWLTFNSAQFNSLIAPKRRFSCFFVGFFSSNSQSFPDQEAFLFEFPVFPVFPVSGEHSNIRLMSGRIVVIRVSPLWSDRPLSYAWEGGRIHLDRCVMFTCESHLVSKYILVTV